MMFVKATYTVEGISFDSYFCAWECLWARKYPSIVLMNNKGDIVHSCEVADIFIVDNQEQADFVEELLINMKGENIYYDDNTIVKQGALIIKDYYGEYGVYNKKEIKKKNKEIKGMIISSYSPESAVRRYYQI